MEDENQCTSSLITQVDQICPKQELVGGGGGLNSTSKGSEAQNYKDNVHQ